MIKDLSGVSVSILFLTLILGAVISILIQMLVELTRSHFNAQAESRQEARARQREEREEARQKERDEREEVRQTERESRDEKRQVERELREEDGRRLAAARHREEQAAVEVDRMLASISETVPRLARNQVPDDQLRETHQGQRKAMADAQAHAVYLPASQRARINLLLDILRFADELEPDRTGYHYDNVYTIAQNCAEEGHELVAAFLRHQELPAPSLILREYELALQELFREKEWEFAPEIAEDQESRDEWLRSHPGYASALGEQEPAESN